MIRVLVVVYNKKCVDSPAIEFFMKYRDKVKLVVFDNSTKDLGNGKFCKKNKIEYYGFLENWGLPKAYNYVIDKLPKGSDDYLIIADDDTKFNEKYLDAMIKMASEEADIVLPVVKSEKVNISPSYIQWHGRVAHVDKISKLENRKNITGINSGMMVKMDVYRKVKYNEKIFLDYADHDFMRRINKEGGFDIRIADNEIRQNFSRRQKNNIDSEIFRFKIYINDFYVYCKDGGFYPFYVLSMLKYRIEECIKYKKFDFLFLRRKNV